MKSCLSSSTRFMTVFKHTKMGMNFIRNKDNAHHLDSTVGVWLYLLCINLPTNRSHPSMKSS